MCNQGRGVAVAGFSVASRPRSWAVLKPQVLMLERATSFAVVLEA